jgi:hypothetical protein
MRLNRPASILCLLTLTPAAWAQVAQVEPHTRTKIQIDGKVTALEVAAHFVTTIRVPEAVNAVAVGDPALFQVEHSEREPDLVFVRALVARPAETNLLISTVRGRQVSLLLINRGSQISSSVEKIDFLLQFKPATGFLIEQQGYTPPPLSEATNVSSPVKPPFVAVAGQALERSSSSSESRGHDDGLNRLLERQQRAPLPELYGGHLDSDENPGPRIRAGVSEVIDGGQRVIVLFSALNPSKGSILLMPPQVQLGGKTKSGKLIKHSEWSTAEQLAVLDYRLTRRRLGPGERADGVVVFERPPYKQSSEMLLLQVAEAGAVDKPALAPIGFGVSSSEEDASNGNRKDGQ